MNANTTVKVGRKNGRVFLKEEECRNYHVRARRTDARSGIAQLASGKHQRVKRD